MNDAAAFSYTAGQQDTIVRPVKDAGMNKYTDLFMELQRVARKLERGLWEDG